MEQYLKKNVKFDATAQREFMGLPKYIRREFHELIDELRTEGYLQMPHGRKFIGTKLFEMRVTSSTAWRGFYVYVEDHIILLSFFNKKSQKTSRDEVQKALNRLKRL